jgi:polyvinyl alcohol dehydrogenase (cytochrome)
VGTLLAILFLSGLFLVPISSASEDYYNELTTGNGFSADPALFNLGDPGETWASWGHDVINSRFNPLANDIRPNNLDKLKLKWSFVFPDTHAASSQPAVVDNTLYVGSWNAKFYALNAKTGQLKWTYDTASFTGPLPAGTTNAVRMGPAVSQGRVYMGDLLGNFYALNARTGALIWAKKLDPHPTARITGSPVVWNDRVYIGVSSVEPGIALDPTYPCCTFRGSLVALNGKNGNEIWRYYPVSQTPVQTGVNAIGKPQYGPNGGAVWSTPAIDPLSNTIYFGTGQNYSNPATDRTDSLIALDLTNGHERWVTQLTPNDTWNLSCNPELFGLPPGAFPNCPVPGRTESDYDVGSPNIFITYKDGHLRTLVGAGQKSGIYHALDARTGQIVWQTQLSIGGIGGGGGILWGSSWDGQRIYVSTSAANPGSLNALDPATGHILWTTKDPSNGCTTGGSAGDPFCLLSMGAPPSNVPGLTFHGSLDGKFRAFDSRTGAILWQYDTRQNFTGVNGVTGRGGSINAAGATIVDGFVYVNSGYQPFVVPGIGMDGNVLLAFAKN